MKPPVSYYGSKMTLADQIVRLLPAHQHYVEPYCGSLAVLLAKPPSKMETVNDLDGELVTFWRVLRDRPDDLARAAALTPHSRAEHQASYEPAVDELETARRVWVRLTQGRSGSMRRTGWRHYVDPAGSSISMPDYLEAYRDRMHPAAVRLAEVSLEARPALDLIARYGRHPDVLLYVDPPYLRSTRSGTNYRHEMPGDAEHRELAEALRAARAAVVLSGYPSPLYDEVYAGWHRIDLPTGTGQGEGWQARTEVLWSNRPLGNAPTLFDLDHAGAA
jgi:DNA adenine methylase